MTDRQNLPALQARINRMDPVDLAAAFETLSAYDTAVRMKLLHKDLLADTLSLLIYFEVATRLIGF